MTTPFGRVEEVIEPASTAWLPLGAPSVQARWATAQHGLPWARMASLIGTCKLNGVNPQAYLEHVLEKMLGGHRQGDIQELMPWNFTVW